MAFTSLTDGLLTLTAAAITDVFTLSNIAGAPTAAAITELSFTDDAGGFWNAAAENYSAFKLMLPDIAKWVADNPTATPAEFFEEFSTKEIYAPAYAAVNYVETFASKDELADGNFVLNWAVSTDAGYPKATQPPVKAYLLKDESVTIKPELAAASVVDSKNKATSIKPDTRIFRVEVASFDKGKPVYGPEDVTNGLTIDKAFVEKNPSLLVRVMFTSKGNQDVMTNSVGILKEEQDEEGNGGTLPVGTLKLDPVAGYATANTALFTALAEGYPYFVEFPLQLAVSFDTAGGSGTTTAETYALKAGSIDLVGSDGKTLTVAANTKYVTNQDTAAKDALWTAAPVVFKVSSDQFASFEITVSTDYAVVAVNDSEGGDVKVDGKKIEVLGIEDIYTVILSADLVASSDAKTISTDSGYFAITVDVASVSVAPVVPGETSPSVPGETSPEVPGETSPEVPGTETEPVAADAAETTTDASGNTVAAPGQPIANAFTGSNGASAVSSLINSATAAEMAGAADVAGALGLDEDEIGDATKGYKAIGFKMTQATMPAEGTPLFVIVRKGSTNHVGFGYVPKRREGFETILAVLFKLFRDPADTTNYMTVDAGDNTVAATDS
ncbi:MAG: hypothetical protein IJ667_13060, partial [Synergistaceae bacterium]|nr:hypothetical protein [Synergistaceae bacterium]